MTFERSDRSCKKKKPVLMVMLVSPSQVCVYSFLFDPGLHSQVYDPMVFSQMAPCLLHIRRMLCFAHSSRSKVSKNTL